jgi:hypothetical protein
MTETNQTPKPEEKPGVEQNVVAGQPVDVQPGQMSKEANKDARMWSMICHLAGLAGLVVPIVGSIVGPLVIWQIKKDEFPFTNEQGKEAVNFQISMSLYLLISAILWIPLSFVCIGVFVPVAIGIVDLVFLLIAAVKANNGYHYRYPLTIRFIK